MDPLLHVAELDVADDVVDRHQQHVVGVAGSLGARLVAGQEGSVVVVAVHEQVERVAVGLDRRELHAAVLVLLPARRHHAAGALSHRVLVRGCGVGHAERDLVDAVAVAGVVAGDLIAAAERPGQHEPDAALLEDV
jgi:hypothetical protein